MSESLKHDYETVPILGSPAVSERDVAAVRLVGCQNQTLYREKGLLGAFSNTARKRMKGEAMYSIQSVSLDDAQRVIQAGIAKANEIGSPSNIAVADAGGNLLAFARMQKAWLGSIDIAINKAFTSRAFDIATKQLADFTQPGEEFYGIQTSNHGRVMIFAGGLPLKSGGEVVGAVGVSGGSGQQDQQIAEAAAAAL